MPPKASVWVVIAAYNEAVVIGSVAREVAQRGYHVILIDDGSKDETGDLAATAGARVLTHPVNLGQGAALQTGIKFALQQGASFIVTLDADGQHRAADIHRFVEALEKNNADLALGS